MRRAAHTGEWHFLKFLLQFLRRCLICRRVIHDDHYDLPGINFVDDTCLPSRPGNPQYADYRQYIWHHKIPAGTGEVDEVDYRFTVYVCPRVASSRRHFDCK